MSKLTERIADEINYIFDTNVSPEYFITDITDVRNQLNVLKRMPRKNQINAVDAIYVLTIVQYRLFKVGFNTLRPIWDTETIENLELCAGLGCNRAWYDLAQFYKNHPQFEELAIDAYEMCLQNNLYIAFEELVNLHNKYRKEKNYKFCNQIKFVLDKYHTSILKNILKI